MQKIPPNFERLQLYVGRDDNGKTNRPKSQADNAPVQGY